MITTECRALFITINEIITIIFRLPFLALIALEQWFLTFLDQRTPKSYKKFRGPLKCQLPLLVDR